MSNQQVKVLDFGLATVTDQRETPSGTLAYMAPELLRSVPATVASDLFAAPLLLKPTPKQLFATPFSAKPMSKQLFAAPLSIQPSVKREAGTRFAAITG